MSDHHAEDTAALRLELSSLRARQEVLADALAAAGDELELIVRLVREADALLADPAGHPIDAINQARQVLRPIRGGDA